MEYKGKLYAKLGNKYIALEETADDFDKLKSINIEMLEMLIKCKNTLKNAYECDVQELENLIQKATTL